MLMRTEAFRSSQGAAAPSFTEHSSSAADHLTAENPWDDTVAVPDASNRVILDFTWWQGNLESAANVIDPGGGSQASLTKIHGTTVNNERHTLHALLEASMPAANNYTLRATPHGGANDNGIRQIVILSAARQALSSNEGESATVIDNITIAATRSGGGNFPAGSRVYAVASVSQTGGACTVTGDATEVREPDLSSGGDSGCFAAGALASSQASASVTFTWSVSGSRKAVIVVVEPA